MRSCAVFTAAIAIIWLAAFPAKAAEVDTFNIAGWEGRAFTDDDTGDFSHCAILADYHNGFTLIFAVGIDAVWWMSLVNPDWNLKPETEHPIYYRVDELGFIEDNGFVVDIDQINVELGHGNPLVDQMRDGAALTVEFGGNRWSFDLGGSNVAFDETTACTKFHYSAGTRSSPQLQPRAEAAERDEAPRREGEPGADEGDSDSGGLDSGGLTALQPIIRERTGAS